MPKFKICCSNCGKEIERYFKEKPERVYCSVKCQHEYRTNNMKTGTYKKCPICEKEFYVSKCDTTKNKTCSRECQYKYLSSIGNYSKENCNFWKGGITQNGRGDNWNQQRYLARKRDNNTCQLCNKDHIQLEQNMSVHHILPYEWFNGDYKQANKLENLICLCPSCHMKVERKTDNLEKNIDQSPQSLLLKLINTILSQD